MVSNVLYTRVRSTESGVHPVDVRLERGPGLGSLQLERRGEEPVLDAEQLRVEVHSLDLLEPLEARAFAHREHALVNHLRHGRVRAEPLEVTARWVPAFRGPRQENLLVRHDHGDERRHQRVAVDEALRDKLASRVDVLNLLGRDVLALRQLEDVLLAVDDLEPAAGQPQADVARVQPPLVVDDLVRLCLLYTSPSPRDLSTSRMPSSA